MSDDKKPKYDPKYDFPMMPIFGVDLGERLGSMDARLVRVESDIQEIKQDIKALDAKFEAKIGDLDAKFEAKIGALDVKTDKMAYALNRLDERTKVLQIIGGGTLVAVLAGLILQIIK